MRRLIAPLMVGAALMALPIALSDYAESMLVSMLMYVVLAMAWNLFSGTSGYASLGVAAFFGVGAYTMAVLGDRLPVLAVLGLAGVLSFLLALLVGLSTLRLRGVYFVVFTFGLAELIRQSVIWWEVHVTGTVGRWVVSPIEPLQAYWCMLGLAVALYLLHDFLIDHHRFGHGLKIIGQDEEVAEHLGVNTRLVKTIGFSVSSVFLGVAGAVMATRWTYIDPNIVFDPVISFQVLIMVLFGGKGRILGPLTGAVPIVLLSEFLSTHFPYVFRLLLGLFFIVSIYGFPEGVTGLFATCAQRLRRWRAERRHSRAAA